ICATCMCRGSASARRPDRGTRDWRGRLTPEAGLRTGHAAMRAMDGLCALGHGLPDDRLTLRRSMQCRAETAVSVRDACKPLQAFMAVNVAAPRSSVKMCEKPARSPPNHGFRRQFGAYYTAAAGPSRGGSRAGKSLGVAYDRSQSCNPASPCG